MPDRPLHGYTILVTRPAGSGGELCGRLEELGAVVEERPAIALEPATDRAPVLHALASLEQFDWLVFTSPRGVHFFFSLLHEMRGAIPEIEARVGSIGPATSRALRERGLPPDVEAEESKAEGLASALAENVKAGQRILLVRPEITRPLLAESLKMLEAEVSSVAFYRNVAAPGLREVARDVCDDRYEVIILTSPSALERLLGAAASDGLEIKEALLRSAVVTIGDVTARAVTDAGLSVAAVAERPTLAGLADAVQRLFEQ
jgi:uroporphyrinogen III methyltransferase/synthase